MSSNLRTNNTGKGHISAATNDATAHNAKMTTKNDIVKKNLLFSDEFLRKIPKADLHCHLDGSVRISTLIDLCREQGLDVLPSYDEDELRTLIFKSHYGSLEE